jgi:hypothetical protein
LLRVPEELCRRGRQTVEESEVGDLLSGKMLLRSGGVRNIRAYLCVVVLASGGNIMAFKSQAGPRTPFLQRFDPDVRVVLALK